MKKLNIVFRVGTNLCLALLLVPSMVSAATLYRQLQIGSRGSDVSDLQSFLAADATIYPQGLVTGYFGSLTATAVRRFQARNGISQVGRVGPQTMAAINAQMGGGQVSANVAPMINFASSTNVGGTAQFTILTDMPAKASVFYSASPIVASENLNMNPITLNISGTGVKSNDNLLTSHSIYTSQLSPNTRYYYMVVVMSSLGELSVHSSSFVSGNF